MRIGILSTAYFEFDDYAAGFARMRMHGYDCVDINHFVDNTGNELFTCSNAE